MDLMLNVNSSRKYSEKQFIFKHTQAQQVYTICMRYINPYLGLLYFLDVTGKKWYDTLP